jgi:pimeloyl-ACP methyl ester carboxylesterase
MNDLAHRNVSVNGITIHFAEQSTGPLVVLCHGFPELWYSWRHQLPALAEAGYRAVAPDGRGYGGSGGPPEIEAYDILHLTADLTGLLDALGEDQAVFVGHDWGAIVAWNLALLAPERVRAVIGLSVPFIPRQPVPPTQLFQTLAGDRFLYLLYFQDVGPADRELDEDPERSLRVMYSAISGDAPRSSFRRIRKEGGRYLDQFRPPEGLPPWLTEDDLDVFVQGFRRSGFTRPLHWYRNFDRNWELTEHVAGARVHQPALFMVGERDHVRRIIPPGLMDGWVTDLRDQVVLPGCGHWTQQERPDEVNQALLSFLSGL